MFCFFFALSSRCTCKFERLTFPPVNGAEVKDDMEESVICIDDDSERWFRPCGADKRDGRGQCPRSLTAPLSLNTTQFCVSSVCRMFTLTNSLLDVDVNWLMWAEEKCLTLWWDANLPQVVLPYAQMTHTHRAAAK